MDKKCNNQTIKRRNFIPFFEKLYKIRAIIGEMIVNQTQIQVLLVTLIYLRSLKKFSRRDIEKWGFKLSENTLGKLIFIFEGFSYNSEQSLIKKLKKFNEIRNKIMHKINFYEGKIAVSYGKQKVDFDSIKKSLVEISDDAREIINELEELTRHEHEELFNTVFKKHEKQQ
jgi:hypothetical protein